MDWLESSRSSWVKPQWLPSALSRAQSEVMQELKQDLDSVILQMCGQHESQQPSSPINKLRLMLAGVPRDTGG